MAAKITERNDVQVSLRPVSQDNWRDVAKLKVSEVQREFVAEPSYYLALCCYGNDWHPLAICLDEQVIGLMMWTTDPADGSCWLGGIMVDQGMQRRGYGRLAVQAAVEMLWHICEVQLPSYRFSYPASCLSGPGRVEDGWTHSFPRSLLVHISSFSLFCMAGRVIPKSLSILRHLWIVGDYLVKS